MSAGGYGSRRGSPGGGGTGSLGTRTGKNPRNTAAIEAQRRLTKIMFGQQEEERDEEDYELPPQAARQLRGAPQQPLALPRRNSSVGPHSPESDTYSYSESQRGSARSSARYG